MRLFHFYSLLCLPLFVLPVDGLAANSETKAALSSGAVATGVPGTSASTQPLSSFPRPPITPKLDCLIEPNMMVDLATSVSGIVKVVNVDRGDIIKTGQILAQLEAEVEKANVAHSSARVEFSSKKYHRMQELYKEQMVSAQQMEEAKSENDLAVAELRKANEMLNQRTVFSPFSGVVVDRYVSPGELVEGKKVIKVAQINPLRVEVIAPISMLGEFKIGAKMQVAPEGPAAGPFEASVHLVDRVIDAPSGTFRVRLTLPNPKYQISAGVRCKAQLIMLKPEMPKGVAPKAKATKVDVPKGEVGKRPGAPKANAHGVDAPKSEAPSAVTPKVGAPKAEASPGDAAKEEVHSAETQNADASKADVSIENAPKGEEPKADAQKSELPENSAPGAETPRADSLKLKTEAPKGEVQRREEPKADLPTEKAPKGEEPKVEAPKAVLPKSEVSGAGGPKVDSQKTETPKGEVQPKSEDRENIPAGYDTDT